MNCYGEKLLLFGTAVAIQIGQTLSVDEMALFGSLLNVIGDQLTLLAITKEEEKEQAKNKTTEKAAAETQKQ